MSARRVQITCVSEVAKRAQEASAIEDECWITIDPCLRVIVESRKGFHPPRRSESQIRADCITLRIRIAAKNEAPRVQSGLQGRQHADRRAYAPDRRVGMPVAF